MMWCFGKQFTQAQHLKLYMLIHTGERLHDCYICGKQVTNTRNLKTHMHIHITDKPSDCGVCGKKKI